MPGDEDEAEQFESAKVLVKKGPKEPSAREREYHEARCHVEYRNWCPHCVAARGVGQQHKSSDLNTDPDEKLPTLSIDYGFMSKKGEDGAMPMLCVKEKHSKKHAASVVDAKGATDYATSFLVGVIKELAYKRIVFKSDNEPAILALKDKVIASMP